MPRTRFGRACTGRRKQSSWKPKRRSPAPPLQTIYLQSGISHAMPPGSTVLMDDYARQDIRDWYERVTGS